ncbi:MAG TPA: hypothetical protein VFL80_05870 [Thermoanaerobaculia bacterium]|nr:hypothetical protein [Thermoanaerobaculia bacterium]
MGLAALGAMHLWDRRRSRPAIIAAGLVALLSIAATSQAMHGDVLDEQDPLPLLERVRGQQCQVVYADFWIAYRYRFLDGERSAWIPYLSQNRTRRESLEYQKLPGQRCLVRNDGSVERIAGDLPLFNPPGRPSASLPPVRPPGAR